MKKIVSLILLQAFLFYNAGFATVNRDLAARKDADPAAEISVDSIAISKDIGSIKTRHSGKNGKLIIHLQDAHCNYEAQQNIARILEHLVKNYGVNFVAVEGADGIVDTSWFKAFPDAEIREEVADYFMKKGEITGTEFLSITSDHSFTIYGAEDRKYYIENLNSFLESYPYKEEFHKHYTNIKTALGKLKRFIYTKELMILDRKINAHKAKDIKFADYAAYLKKIAISKKINVGDYKNFKILTETLRYEKGINFDTVNEERTRLIDELSKVLPKDALSKLVSRSLEFKLDKIEANEFYTYLAKLAKENNISFSEEYDNLARYIIYSRIYSSIDNEKLFDEIDSLVMALKEKMFTNEPQRALNALWTNVNIIIGFMNIELTNREYEYYLANKGEFSPDKFDSFLKQNSSRFGLAYDINEAPPELSRVFPKLVDFYEIATKRDEILIENMFKGMRGKKTDVAVLITGGFHTKGIEKMLEEKDASYVVMSPAITKEADSPYISVLTGQKTPFEELLVRTEKAELLQVADKICGTCMDKRITDSRVNDAGREFYAEIAEKLIKAYARLFADTPEDTIKRLLIDNFKKASKSCPNRSGSRYILTKIRNNFDSVYNFVTEDEPKFVQLLEEIKADVAGKEFTRHKQFEGVKNILIQGEASNLAEKLESLRGLVKAASPYDITSQIDKIAENVLERNILRLAFFRVAEGAEELDANILIENAKKEYADIHGEDKADEGYQRSIMRLGSEDKIRAIINEVESGAAPRVAMAMAFGKGDIFRFWNDMTTKNKRLLLQQLNDFSIAEVEGYYRELVVDGLKKKGIDLSAVKIESSEARDARKKDNQYRKAVAAGEAAFRKGEIAFLDLAGGKGGRLGFAHSKAMLPASQVMNKSIARLRAERIRTLSEKYGKPVPWLLMTSSDTDKELKEFFGKHIVRIPSNSMYCGYEVVNQEYYFGLIPAKLMVDGEQVRPVKFVKQRSFPQVTDNGEYLINRTPEGNYELVVGGFGHGDARDWIVKDKGVQGWLGKFGAKYIATLNVDNAFITDVSAFGWHILSAQHENILPGEEHMSVVAVEKTYPMEKLGMSVILNGNMGMIEYNQVPPRLMYLMFTYRISAEHFVIFKDDEGNISLRPVDDGTEEDMALFFEEHYKEEIIDDMKRKGLEIDGEFIYGDKFDKWIGSHLLAIEDVPEAGANGEGFELPLFRGVHYTRNLLEQHAHLQLRVGSINQLIWSVNSFGNAQFPLPDLPASVAMNKPVDAFLPGTREYHTRASGAIKAHKFETFAFDNFHVVRVKGAVILVDRPGGFAPIKNQNAVGKDTMETAAMLFDEYDKRPLRERKNWTISDEALIELSSAFRELINDNVDNVAQNARIGGKGAQVYLSGRDTKIGRGFLVGDGQIVRIRIENEYVPCTKVRIGDHVEIAANFTITMEGNGEIVVRPGAIIQKTIDLTLEDGQSLIVEEDGTCIIESNVVSKAYEVPLPDGYDDGEWEWTPGSEGTKIQLKRNPTVFAIRLLDGKFGAPSGGMPVGQLTRVDPDELVNGLLGKYREDEAADIEALEGIIRPTAIAVEEYLYGQVESQKIEPEVYAKGMKNIIPNLAVWFTDEHKDEATKQGIINAVRDKRWEVIAQAYFDDIAFGTAGVRGKFAFDGDFDKMADAADKHVGLLADIFKGPNTFNNEVLKSFTLGVLRWLESKNQGSNRSELKLFTGYDSRIAGRELAELIQNIGLAYGATVYISDEAMPLPEFSCSLQELSGEKGAIGIYVSASHNPKSSNGVKLMARDGRQMGADPIERAEILKEFRAAKTGEVKELLETVPSEIPVARLAFMGGAEKLEGVEYGEHELIDTHTLHERAVFDHIQDEDIIEKHASELSILYCAFNGTGRKATPRMLRNKGFNVEVVEKMHDLDGRFPYFESHENPDPALPQSWKYAIDAYLEEHTREDLFGKDFFLSNDPDADRYGVVVRVSADEIPAFEEAAEAMGIVFKLTAEEQRKHGFGGFRVVSPNEGGALIAKYDLDILERTGKLDPKRHCLIRSNVTSAICRKIAELFGIDEYVMPVGVDQMATLIAILEDAETYVRVDNTPEAEQAYIELMYRLFGERIASPVKNIKTRIQELIATLKEANKEVVAGIEESGTYATGRHIRDKDGFLAGIRLAEIACHARSQGKILNDLLDEISLNRELGFFATTNTPIEFEVSIPGTARKISMVRRVQKKLVPYIEGKVGAGENVVIAGDRIFDTDDQEMFRSGKYDDMFDYPGFPDAGLRFYFNEGKTSYMTIRPSGTGPQMRFYLHLNPATEDGMTKAELARLKKSAFLHAFFVTRTWMEIANMLTDAKDIDTMDIGAEIERISERNEAEERKTTIVEALQNIRKTERHTLKPAAPLEQTGESKRELVGIAEGSVVEKYTIQMGDTLASDPIAINRPQVLFVEEGEIAVLDDKGEEIAKAEKGESVEAPSGEYEIRGTAASLVDLIYEPGRAESQVVAGFEAMRSSTTRAGFAAIKNDSDKPSEERAHRPIIIHEPATLHANSSFLESKTAIRSVSGDTVELNQYGRTIEELKGVHFDPAYEHVFVIYTDDLERIKTHENLAQELRNVLTQKIIPVTRPEISKEANGVANAREIEAAAIILGLTTVEELEGELTAGNALTLQRIMSRLVGEDVTPEALLALMGGSADRIAERIDLMLERLVPFTEGMRREVRARRELLWSL